MFVCTYSDNREVDRRLFLVLYSICGFFSVPPENANL